MNGNSRDEIAARAEANFDACELELQRAVLAWELARLHRYQGGAELAAAEKRLEVARAARNAAYDHLQKCGL